MSFIYYICLLFMLFFIVTLLFNNKEKSPKKIKVFISIGLIMFLLRYSSLILLCLIENIDIVYKLKGLVYINYLGIPFLALSLLYINLRFNKLSFNLVYIVSGVLTLIYIIGMSFIGGGVSLSSKFGYIINLRGGNIIDSFIIIIMGVVLILTLIFIDKPNSNRSGLYLLVVFIIIMMLEIIMTIFNKTIFPYTIISEFFFLTIVKLAINSFQKHR